MEYLPINDLPNELLELIFDHLSVNDLKDASLVCKRWSDLAFSGRRMDHVLLVAKIPWNKDLLQSNRKYHHVELRESRKDFAYVKKLLQTFNVSSLRISDYSVSRSALRSILLEVPNLQHLSIDREPYQTNKMIEPLPVMKKLECLEIEYNFLESAIPWHTIAPSLHGLKMDCNSEAQLEQWRHFSGQLKQVYGTFQEDDLFNRFCQMTFPFLEEVSMKSFLSFGTNEAFVQRHSLLTHHEFFRRNASLRRLRLDGIYISKTLVEDITNHNKKLTSLEIIATFHGFREFREFHRFHGLIDPSEPGSLESLAQLPELKHLRVQLLDVCIFRGCEALTSLQSLSINGTTFGRKSTLGFFVDLLQIAPQLRCLELRLESGVITARTVQFICNNFSKLTHLQLKYSEKTTHGGLSEIHRLPLLWYLELKLITQNILFISSIPPNKVRCLTLHLPKKYDGDDLLQLPEVFPQLVRLNLINLRKVLHESTVDKLCQLLPTCAIIIYGPLITNAGTKRRFRKWTGSEMMPVWEKEWTWHH